VQTFAPTRIRKGSPVPYYEQLKQLLVQSIERDGLEPGAMLPSEAELCESYGVSRTVVRQAIGELVNEGRLYRMRGKGTFVARRAPRSQFMESTVGFFEEPPQDAGKLVRRVLHCALDEPPPHLAELLGDPGECVRIDRVREVDDEPLSYSRHYLPAWLHPQLLEQLRGFDHGTRSIYDFLEDVCGLQILSGHRTLEAVATPAPVARILHMQPRAPALFVRSVSHDAQDVPIECFEAWHRGDRVQFDIDVAGRPRSTTLA
jgi:GntR family transcriptional regulator